MEKDIKLKYMPEMKNALLIACFEGWGNALEVSNGMANFLIRKLDAKHFGEIRFDEYYIFQEKRPVIEVKDGILKNLDLPGCDLYAVKKENSGRDMIILKGNEPDLQWLRFSENILELCRDVGVKTVVSCGGMLDNILHTDTIISVLASSKKLLDELRSHNASIINYRGQSSIHSTLHNEAKKRGFDCIGLYCHCPYYLQGVTHFGLLSYLGRFLSRWAGFELDTEELTLAWREVNKQIQDAINKNPEMKNIVNDIVKSKGKGRYSPRKKGEKVIKLEDYMGI